MTAHARKGDPIGSHLTIASICADVSLATLILWAVTIHTDEGQPATDDDVIQLMEARTKRRFQRNVIARARVRLERENELVRVPPVIGRTGRPTVAYVLPSPVQLSLIPTNEGD